MAMATREVDREFSKEEIFDLFFALDSKSQEPHEDNGGEREAERGEEDERDDGKEDENDDDDDDEVLASDLRTNQRVLWDLCGLLEPGEDLQHVTIDGLDYVSLIQEAIVFHATKRMFGYRGYKALLLNDVAIYLWHVTEIMNEGILEKILPCSRDQKTGGRAAVSHDVFGKAKERFKLDVLVPTVTCTSLVKIAECDGADRRSFRCDYQFTRGRVPESAFRHIVQSLRQLYHCTDAEKDTIRLHNFRKEDHVAARVPKSTPVFKESDIRGSPLGGFTDVEFFSDWRAIKKDIIDERKRRMSASNEGAPGQPKRAKREELAQKEPDLKDLVPRTVSSKNLFYYL